MAPVAQHFQGPTSLAVRACQQGLGIAALPDYLVVEDNAWCNCRRNRFDPGRYVFCLSRRVETSAGAGVTATSGEQGAALAV